MADIDEVLRERGDKIDFHVRLYPYELRVIDELAVKFDCSRAQIIGAWSRLHVSDDKGIGTKLKAGRREGGGRKKRAPAVKSKGYL